MDIFSHGLYGGVAFGRRSKKDYLTAFLFGIGPDLLAFGPFFLSVLLGFAKWPTHFEPPSNGMIPQYVHSFYNVTHSLVIYGIFFALLWWVFKKRDFAKLTLGWPLHILVDIPTHSTAFFPTPFLWPVSDFHINGVPWSEPYIFIPNVLVIVGLYTYWYIKRKKSYN